VLKNLKIRWDAKLESNWRWGSNLEPIEFPIRCQQLVTAATWSVGPGSSRGKGTAGSRQAKNYIL